MYKISRIPRVLIKKSTMNHMGLFNLADFQQARAFQKTIQIKIRYNIQGAILNCDAKKDNSSFIID